MEGRDLREASMEVKDLREDSMEVRDLKEALMVDKGFKVVRDLLHRVRSIYLFAYNLKVSIFIQVDKDLKVTLMEVRNHLVGHGFFILIR